jgi:predicted nucleic acid-binding protein
VAVYLDASALVKLVVAEAESSALVRFLRGHPTRVTSALSHVEVLRAVRHVGDGARTRARRVLARVQQLRLDDEVLDVAWS